MTWITTSRSRAPSNSTAKIFCRSVNRSKPFSTGTVSPLTKKGWFGYTYEEPSVFPFGEMRIEADEPFEVEADGKVTKELKVKITMAKEKIDMIVGRNRKF
jgi:diacylglycerol kinase family enzyme